MNEEMTRKERSKILDDFLSSATKTKICDSCPSARRSRLGYENPCKKGHHNSGMYKELCEDHPNPRYHPKK